ncbi:MAG: glycosyltransferase family 4 protein [Nitrososphaeria archaeon]
MKILFLTQFFSATRGGGEVIFTQWAKELCRRGHDVYVICHIMKNSKQSNNEIENLHVIEIPPVIFFKGGLPPSITENALYLMNSVRIGFKVLRKYDIDVIHSNNFTPVIAGFLLSKMTGIPLVVTIHDVFSLAGRIYWNMWSNQLKASFLTPVIGPILEKITVKIPSIIHAVSETTKEDLIRFGTRNPIVVIPNGVDLSIFKLNTIPNYYNHQVLFIGRLIFYKNLPVILKALKIVKQAVPDVRLIVIGDGPSREQWQLLTKQLGLSDSVRFMGYVSEKVKLKILNESMVLVLPSFIEGFGLVILEAFAMKKPVIASKVPPMTEIIDHGVDGYLVSPFNECEWAEKIIDILQHPKIASEMGSRGRIKVEKHFTIKKAVDRLEKLYSYIS